MLFLLPVFEWEFLLLLSCPSLTIVCPLSVFGVGGSFMFTALWICVPVPKGLLLYLVQMQITRYWILALTSNEIE